MFESLAIGEFEHAHVVVRSNHAGVWFGRLVRASGDARTVVLADARRAWQWTGALSCSELARLGPGGGRICGAVHMAIVNDCCEVLMATREAAERWDAQPDATDRE